jgi:glutamate decarboxylase
MLDGNARMNLATFVSTWMEPQAEKLMAECLDKNMIDKDEYPQTAAARGALRRDPEPPLACARGSARDRMLDDRLERGRDARRSRAQAPLAEASSGRRQAADRPNLVMGINVQVCWEKFAKYWDVEMRLVPMDGDRFHLSAEEAVKLCDENTIGVVAVLGSTFDGSYEPVEEICAALDDFEEREGIDIPVHVDGASGAFVAPFVDPDLAWDFRLPRVVSINASGHKYGLVYPGVGWIVWRDGDVLPEELIFWVNYLGDDMPTLALNFSRPGAPVVAQYYNFLRLGFDGYRRVQTYAREVDDAARGPDRGPRPVPAPHTRRRAAGLRVHAHAGHRQLHRLRRLERHSRARVARAGLHVPEESHRPGSAPCGGEAGLQPRHGRLARRRPRAPAAPPQEPSSASTRWCRRHRLPSLDGDPGWA